MKLLPIILAALLSFSLLGCGGKKEEHTEGAEGHEEHEEGAEGASYAEGKGITLIEETSKAIGLEVLAAEERKLSPIVKVDAQIYRSASEPSRVNAEQTGTAYAAAFIGSGQGDKMKVGDSASLSKGDREFPAKVWRIDASSAEAVNKVEAILEIPDPEHVLKVGDFVSGEVQESGQEADVISVPRSAVLETSGGKFVFVQNGDFLLRTPVTTGAESAEYIEITDGLYAGDVVAIKPVETLYLIELRATKGGGHSH